MIRIGSLFSGYGGLDIAVQAVVGGELAWYSEIEPAACKVLAAHHPGVVNLGDITAVDWTVVKPVDVITGGFPCQPFSHAGKRQGVDDERHLWPYCVDAIQNLAPGLAVFENVLGLLSIVEERDEVAGDAQGWGVVGVAGRPVRRLAFLTVLADLAAIGYDARWIAVRASDAGAPHGRARVFIAAYPSRGTGREGTGWGVPESSRAAGLAARDFASPSADADGDRHGQQLHPRRVGGVEGEAEGEPRQRERPRRVPDSGGDLPPADAGNGEWEIDAGDDGIDGQRSTQRWGSVVAAGAGGSDVDHLGALARPHAATGEPATGHRRAPADADGAAGPERDERETARRRVQHRDHVAGSRVRRDAVDWGKYEPAIRRWERTLDRPAPDPTVPGTNGRPRLSPVFVEWMMGLPLGHVTGHGLKNTQELKALGNGVVPAQAALALRMLGVS